MDCGQALPRLTSRTLKQHESTILFCESPGAQTRPNPCSDCYNRRRRHRRHRFDSQHVSRNDTYGTGSRSRIPASNVFVNASHCHGQVNPESEESVIATVRTAFKQMEPVTVGVVSTDESRISENRRVRLKDGTQVDMRRAYPMAWDEQIASVGPIDPQVGVVKLARKDHSTLP